MNMSNKKLKDSLVKKTVYGFFHIPSGKYLYVGITVNLSNRVHAHKHRKDIQKDKFHFMLQENPDDFRVDILEQGYADFTGREDYWIQKLNPLNKTNREVAIEKWKRKDNPSGRPNPMYEVHPMLGKTRPDTSKLQRERLTGVYGAGTPRAKPVYQYSLDGVLIKEWGCTKDVDRALNYDFRNISACCLGKRPTAYGYKWSYTKL